MSFFKTSDAGAAADRGSVFDMQKVDPFYNELFKGLRAKIEYKIDMNEIKCIAVSSSITGEGKTLTTINLAISMACTGRKKVLLMDMDLRKGSVAGRLTGIRSRPGLSEFLQGNATAEAIVQNTSNPGLFVITFGKTMESPADLLAGSKFRTLLQDLQSDFDLVLIDTPPIVPVPDAVTISEQVGGFIMLFRLKYTPHYLFRQAIEDLGEERIIGVVLNDEDKKSDKYYNKYYGKYYKQTKTEGKQS